MRSPVRAFFLAFGVLACAPVGAAGPGCAPLGPPFEIARELGETSGVAVGRRDPNVFWTHNDGDSDLYALDRDGRILERFDVPRLRDWEDIEIAACPGAGSCLYVADTGDNAEARAPGESRILRLAEPTVGRRETAAAVDVFPVRFPDGPRDVEALFVLPGEVAYLVTKGGGDAVTLYRYPPPLRPETVTLVEVQRLTDGPVPLLDRVTGASSSPDGSWVVLRTYQALRFYRVRADTLAATDAGLTNLRTLGEIQGEGVGIGSDGLVVLTSEGGPLGGPPSLTLLRCRLAAA